jgi:hypothetical protein
LRVTLTFIKALSSFGFVPWEKLMIKAIGAVLIAVALTSSIPATAGQESCQGAIFVLKSAKAAVGDYLRRYASCVSRNDGRNDCSSEFSRLRSAQEDFEPAVSDYRRECL